MTIAARAWVIVVVLISCGVVYEHIGLFCKAKDLLLAGRMDVCDLMRKAARHCDGK